jgi:FAD:protein FMN transferase
VQYKQQLFPEGIKLFYAWFEAMHTRIDVAISTHADTHGMVEFVNKLQSEINKYEQIGNRFDPKSEISYVNANAFENEVTLSSELFDILAACQTYTYNTMGYFDISVYSTIGFKYDDKAYILNAEKQTVRFTHDGVLLDLSGFLKGYVLSRLIEITEKEGIDNLILNLGNSSVFAKGNHPYGTGWKIQQPETDIECVLLNECMTTSGNSDSTKWPIMNPLDGGVLKNKKAVSVITKDAAQGEVLSKVAYLATEIERKRIFEIFGGRVAN